jgi:hypothetical protein
MIDEISGRSLISGALIGPGVAAAGSAQPEGLQSVNQTAAMPMAAPSWKPGTPGFAILVLLAASMGLYGVSTSARLGPVRGSVAVGK